MITEIALTSQSLKELSTTQQYGYGAPTLWEGLLGSILSHGTLIVTTPTELENIRTLIESDTLTSLEKKQLTTILTQLHKEGRLEIRQHQNTPTGNIDKDTKQLQTILPLIAILPNKEFTNAYPQNTTGTHKITDTTETAVSAAIRQTQTLTNFRNIAETQNFPNGTPREIIWTDLFLTLTEHFNRISICDRYLLSEMIYRDTRTVTAKWHTPEHLAWLLTHIDQNSPTGTHVALYTQIGDPSKDPETPTDADDIVDLIDRQWTNRSGRRIQTIEINAVQWRSRLHPHNRHIRFGDSLAFKLDEGLDRLADDIVKFDSGFNYAYLWRPHHVDKLRADEELIRKTENISRTEWNPHDDNK